MSEDEAEVLANPERGERYRSSVYDRLNYERLEVAPRDERFPRTEAGEYRIAPLPEAPRVRDLIGPSVITLATGLGSGPVLFWPSLASQSGWAIYWAFCIGIIAQFFLNTELQRWTIATGESIFRAFQRMHWYWPWFFLIAGIFQLIWPGWAAGGSQVMAHWMGIDTANWRPIAIASMILIWLLYQVGPVMYNVVEKTEMVLVSIGVVFTVLLVFLSGSADQLSGAPAGAVNFGTIPLEEVDIITFVGGIAYAGIGGYGNLAQSLWAREKGFGMSSYQGRVKNPLRAEETEPVYEDGFAFEPTEINMKRWRAWWRAVQLEHFLTFVLGLAIVGTLLMAIAIEFAAGADIEIEAIGMWTETIIPQLGGIGSFMMYAIIVIALFTTQYGVMEIFIRNGVDIIHEGYGRARGWNISYVFIGLLTIFTLWGILIIGSGFQEPWILLVIGAAVAGAMMWPYSALTVILTTRWLPEHTQPGWARLCIMWAVVAFFGFFSILLVGDVAANQLGLELFTFSLTVFGSEPGGYALWAVFFGIQGYTMWRSAIAKRAAQDTVEDADEARGFLS